MSTTKDRTTATSKTTTVATNTTTTGASSTNPGIICPKQRKACTDDEDCDALLKQIMTAKTSKESNTTTGQASHGSNGGDKKSPSLKDLFAACEKNKLCKQFMRCYNTKQCVDEVNYKGGRLRKLAERLDVKSSRFVTFFTTEVSNSSMHMVHLFLLYLQLHRDSQVPEETRC